MKRIQEILEKYSPEDYEIFYNTVEMLCKKGVGKGTYQDYTVLFDVVQILSICEDVIKEGGAK